MGRFLPGTKDVCSISKTIFKSGKIFAALMLAVVAFLLLWALSLSRKIPGEKQRTGYGRRLKRRKSFRPGFGNRFIF